MSSIFTYEIDERSIRIQLRAMELPLKEEAWVRFSAFQQQNVPPSSGSRFQGLELKLNRNVVLPAVFGAIIILFSFLLFNFISIKNPSSASNQTSVAAAVINDAAPETDVDLRESEPVQSPVLAAEPLSVPSAEKKHEISAPPVVKEFSSADSQQVSTQSGSTEVPVEAAREIRPELSNTMQVQPSAAKKSRKRAEFEEQLRPEVITDESVAGPEEVPN